MQQKTLNFYSFSEIISSRNQQITKIVWYQLKWWSTKYNSPHLCWLPLTFVSISQFLMYWIGIILPTVTDNTFGSKVVIKKIINNETSKIKNINISNITNQNWVDTKHTISIISLSNQLWYEPWKKHIEIFNWEK